MAVVAAGAAGKEMEVEGLGRVVVGMVRGMGVVVRVKVEGLGVRLGVGRGAGVGMGRVEMGC